MARRSSINPVSMRDFAQSSGSSINTEESVNTWDTIEERAKQQIVYYQNIERVACSQIVKELNAMLAIARIKPNKLCQLDRQALTAKLHLIMSKIEATKVAENQILRIQEEVERAKGLLT